MNNTKLVDSLQKNFHNKKNMIIMSSIVIFLIGIHDTGNFYLIHFSGDEQAPIGIAANFIGLDWSESIQGLGYYSYGYSMFMAPFLYMFKNMTSFYRCMIILNMIMISLIIPISQYILNKIYPSMHWVLSLSISIIVSCYPAHIVRANLAWMETLFQFIFWLILMLSISIFYSEKLTVKTWKLVVLTLLSFYMYLIHQRALGVLISVFIIFIILFVTKKISMKQLVIITVATIICFILNSVLKQSILENVWLTSQLNSKNDYSGILQRVKGILSNPDDFFSFLKAVLGQIFYTSISSFFLVYYILFKFISEIVQSFKNKFKQTSPKVMCATFLTLVFVSTFAISTVFMSEMSGLTHLVYGRYLDTIIPSLILFALSDIFTNISTDKLTKNIVLNQLISLLTIFFIFLSVSYILSSLSNDFINSVFMPINSFATKFYYSDNVVDFVKGTCISALFFVMIYYAPYLLNGKKRIIAFTTASVIMLSTVSPFVNIAIVPQGELFIRDQYLVDKFRYDDQPIYFTGDILHMQYFQYLAREKSIHYYTEGETTLPDEHLYLLNSFLPFEYMEDYDIIDQVNGTFLMQKRNRPQKVIDKKLILTPDFFYYNSNVKTASKISDRDHSISNHKTNTMLTFGPYLRLQDGHYSWTFRFNISEVEPDDRIFFGRIIISQLGQQFNDVPLELNNIDENGDLTITLDNSFFRGKDDRWATVSLEIQILLEDNVNAELIDVVVQQH